MADPSRNGLGIVSVLTRPGAKGLLASVALVTTLSALMLPVRAHLSVATCALVLIVPVVVGASIGGFVAGVGATLCGFLVYDFIFIKPYYTLTVGAVQNWTALGVYVVVMIVVSRVVDRLNSERQLAHARADLIRRVLGMTELLVRDASTQVMAQEIVEAIRNLFNVEGVTLLMPRKVSDDFGDIGYGEPVNGETWPESGGIPTLEIVAQAGEPLTSFELEGLQHPSERTMKMHTPVGSGRDLEMVALATTSGPIGILALKGLVDREKNDPMIEIFANHLAISLERNRLNQLAVRTRTLERMEILSRSMVGAVSHDLRTPLATIKVASTSLLQADTALSDTDRKELLELVEQQSDRLDRLVSNILDMTRIQSGSLKLELVNTPISKIGELAVEAFSDPASSSRLVVEVPMGIPEVRVDRVLVTQVLVNLVDNALRYSPEEGKVRISFRYRPGTKEVVASVKDEGPGVPLTEREAIFEMFKSKQAGGRGGLGLGIAKAFVEAHGKRIWLEEGAREGAKGTGATFSFSMSAV